MWGSPFQNFQDPLCESWIGKQALAPSATFVFFLHGQNQFFELTWLQKSTEFQSRVSASISRCFTPDVESLVISNTCHLGYAGLRVVSSIRGRGSNPDKISAFRYINSLNILKGYQHRKAAMAIVAVGGRLDMAYTKRRDGCMRQIQILIIEAPRESRHDRATKQAIRHEGDKENSTKQTQRDNGPNRQSYSSFWNSFLVVIKHSNDVVTIIKVTVPPRQSKIIAIAVFNNAIICPIINPAVMLVLHDVALRHLEKATDTSLSLRCS